MSGRARVVLNDHKKKLEDRYIDLIGDNDETIGSAMPPELWPDNVFALLRNEDMVGAAQVVLGGPEPYERFTAAGGTAVMLFSIIRGETGLALGESKASSGS